jgi:hypothetical protein
MLAIAPEPVASAADETMLRKILYGQLRREVNHFDAADREGVQQAGWPAGPSLFAAAQEVRTIKQQPDQVRADRLAACVARGMQELQESANRAFHLSGWTVDPAEDGKHLQDCIDRVLRQMSNDSKIPSPIDIHLVPWRRQDLRSLSMSADILADVWPQMMAEIRTTVRQVAILGGRGIVGFTDFTAHGAVFVGHRRLRDGDGLAGHVRLAESLVHEGTHTRCNAASVARPFLVDGNGRPDEDLVATPLRADPRPLSGLFQQLVVLIRCGLFHRQVADRRDADSCEGSLAASRLFFEQAAEAVRALRKHEEKLSEYGHAVVEDADSILRSEVI